jgi:NTE family protein
MTPRPGAEPLQRDAVRVDLALQGGGAHGAYTWSVLDRLLEEPWRGIEGIQHVPPGFAGGRREAQQHSERPSSSRSNGTGETSA